MPSQFRFEPPRIYVVLRMENLSAVSHYLNFAKAPDREVHFGIRKSFRHPPNVRGFQTVIIQC